MENTATQSQIERATLTASKSVLTFEQCLANVLKQDAKKGWKPMTKKDIIKMNIRNSTKEMNSVEVQEYNEAQLLAQKGLLK
jgi:hypothetical protein